MARFPAQGINRTESIPIYIGDETTDLTAAADKFKVRMPHALTLTEIRASVSGAPTGAVQANSTVTMATPVSNVFSDATIQSVSPVNNVFANGTVQSVSPVNNVFATGTATLVSVAATDTVTINGLIYLAVSGTASEGEFDIDGDDDANAITLRDAINADTRSGTSGDLTATASTNVVTATTDVSGAGGNAITLTSQDATITVSGSGTLTGGVTADIATINGLVYTCVTGPRADDTEFSNDTGDNETATDLAAAVNGDSRSGSLGDVSASATTDTVTLTSDVLGVAGDATTLTSSSDAVRLITSSTVFANGVDADTATINGLVYTCVTGSKGADNTLFSNDTSDTATATDLTDSINNDVRVGTLGDVSATSSTDTVTAVSDVLGVAGDATTLASSSEATRLIISASVFADGVDADTVTVNGLVYTCVSGPRTDDTEFSNDTSNDATATDLAAAITADTRAGTDVPTSDQTAGTVTVVVTITASLFGEIGNSILLASSDGTRLAVSAANLAGGINTLTIDVHKNGTTVMTTNKIEIDNTETTSLGAVTQPILTTIVLANDDLMSVDIDDIGGTAAGKGLKLWLIGIR